MIHILYVFAALVALNLLAMWGLSRLRRGRARTAGMGTLVALDAAMAVLLVLEIGMALFFAQSDGFNLTMSSRKWFERYWQPVNSLGYRDVEPAPRKDGEKIVMVLGDSFAAGHGVDNAADRFGDVLGRKLGQGWRVVNAAKIGWDSAEWFLSGQAFQPDMDKTMAENGIGHKSAIRFRTPGLTGLQGSSF